MTESKWTETELWYAAYVCLCPLYSASHMSAFCGHICRRGHSQIGSVWMCVHKRKRNRERERDFPALYACHISYSCLFLSPVHLYGCDRSHYGFGTASARLANAAFRDGILNVCACSASRAHAHTRPHHQLLPLSAATNMTETIALIICTQIVRFERVDGDAVSCWECFNCRLVNEGLINGKKTISTICHANVRDIVMLQDVD